MNSARKKYGNPSSRKKRALKAFSGNYEHLTKQNLAWLEAHNARITKKFVAEMHTESIAKSLLDDELPPIEINQERLFVAGEGGETIDTGERAENIVSGVIRG